MSLIRDAGGQLKSSARQLLKAILAVFWQGVCFAYIAWWEVNEATRRALTGSILVLLLVASGALLVEIAGTLFGDEIHLLHLPTSLQIMILSLAAAMVFHRVREWRHFQQESLFATTVARIMPEIAWLQFDSPDPQANLENLGEFIEKVLQAFGPVFHSKHLHRVIVMLHDDADGLLKVRYFYPNNAMFNASVFERGEGAPVERLRKTERSIFPPSVSDMESR